jgi:hypothetical protein
MPQAAGKELSGAAKGESGAARRHSTGAHFMPIPWGRAGPVENAVLKSTT